MLLVCAGFTRQLLWLAFPPCYLGKPAAKGEPGTALLHLTPPSSPVKCKLAQFQVGQEGLWAEPCSQLPAAVVHRAILGLCILDPKRAIHCAQPIVQACM